jgi:hypothetical protein
VIHRRRARNAASVVVFGEDLSEATKSARESLEFKVQECEEHYCLTEVVFCPFCGAPESSCEHCIGEGDDCVEWDGEFSVLKEVRWLLEGDECPVCTDIRALFQGIPVWQDLSADTDFSDHNLSWLFDAHPGLYLEGLLWSGALISGNYMRAYVHPDHRKDILEGLHSIRRRLKGAETYPDSCDSAPPLCLFASANDAELIREFVTNGTPVDDPDDDGNTPLMIAAMNGHVEAMKVLFELGANVNACNYWANTPLIRAVKEGKYESVEVLLAARAASALKDDSEMDAIAHAEHCNRSDLVELLQQAAIG